MNESIIPTNPTLAKALRILAELAADRDTGFDWSDALAAELSLPPPARCEALIGAYTTGPGLGWHADQLTSLCGTKTAPLAPADRVRRRYHARMLGHGLAPDRAEFRPLVTVLLPVYNRAG